MAIDKKKTRMSKGQKQYMFMSDVKKASEDYESQATEEAEKAGKRSLWSTVGGVVGAGLALMAAPAVIGAVAGAGLLGTAAAATGASTLATGIGTGLLAGGGSAIGGKKGKKLAESTGAKRKDIEIEKFYDKQAKESNIELKAYDKKIDDTITKQAVVSGLLAGAQAGGLFKSVGSKLKEGLGVGKSTTAATFDSSLVTAKDIGGTGEGLAHLTTKGTASTSQLVEGSTVGVKYSGADIYALPSGTPSFDATSMFAGTSNTSLLNNLKQSIAGMGLQYGTSQILNRPSVVQTEVDEPTSYYG
tara:strand:- start:5784 stop:6689 length:906 start_codon:yes stop_codon:yes gene_type:complete